MGVSELARWGAHVGAGVAVGVDAVVDGEVGAEDEETGEAREGAPSVAESVTIAGGATKAPFRTVGVTSFAPSRDERGTSSSGGVGPAGGEDDSKFTGAGDRGPVSVSLGRGHGLVVTPADVAGDAARSLTQACCVTGLVGRACRTGERNCRACCSSESTVSTFAGVGAAKAPSKKLVSRPPQSLRVLVATACMATSSAAAAA